MLFFISSVKLVAEVALMALLGQFVLGLLAGARRNDNVVYQVLCAVTRPIAAGVRRVVPRRLEDRYIPLAAFAFLLVMWLAATIAKVSYCMRIGVQQCL